MSPQKHLVLDEDVHQALAQRREMTGLPLGHLGNAILRGHIASSFLENHLGKHLVDEGLITAEQYQRALEYADRKVRAEFRPGTAPIEQTAAGTFISGSWESRTIFEDPVGAFQLLEVWVRDALQQPMAQHAHDADEYIVSLGGRAFFIMNGVPATLLKGNMLQIPAGVTHIAMPVSEDCHLVAMIMPAVPEYSTQKSG
ncbi:MAG: hypothetical protein E4H08_04710 [Candidatus Atribacteria bacterium]|nr:MAG: hypothetical protein E4H08_04710 [Candidatus Atribacteria bacterium]